MVFGGLKVEIWSLPGSKSGVVCLRSTQLRQGRPFFDGLPRKTLEGRMAAELVARGRGRRRGGLHGSDVAEASLPEKAAAVPEGGAECSLQEGRSAGVP